MTFLLGLTGSIGMGKSTTAQIFRDHGVPVHDADAAVHALYGGTAAPLIEQAFPGTTAGGVVDRARLSAAVIGDAAALARLEAIVHPLVRTQEEAFIAGCRRANRPVAVLDIPLLLEGGRQRRCDAVVVVTAPAEVQQARVLGRPGMTAGKLDAILARQMPDAQKRRHAHFLVDSGRGLMAARREVGSILRAIAGRGGRDRAAEPAHA